MRHCSLHLQRIMGCIFSTQDDGGTKQSSVLGSEVFVFVPGFRIPKELDFRKALHGRISTTMVEHLSALRTRIEELTAGEGPVLLVKLKRRNSMQHGGCKVYDLQQAVEDYLPALLGLTNEGKLRNAVEFVWTNQEDEQQETMIASSLYELLSVLHLLAMLCLSEANMLLAPKKPIDAFQQKIADDSRKSAIESFLKMSGILVCAKSKVLLEMSEELREKLPADLKVDVLHALSMQALGQAVEIQLGMAIENIKATLAVKRRLACEQVKYWKEAQESLHVVHLGGRYGAKHIHFVKWKLAEAKAAAYYYHGLILDEANDVDTRGKAITCLKAAEAYLKESQCVCREFCATAPATRMPPLWGAMKYLSEKIPKESAGMMWMNRNASHGQKSSQIPDLPDFPLALLAEEYELPSIDSCWEFDSQSNDVSTNPDCFY